MDQFRSVTDAAALERIRAEFEALLESERLLEASWQALGEEYGFEQTIKLETRKLPPETWLDSDKIQPWASRAGAASITAVLVMMAVAAAFVLFRLATAAPLTAPTAMVSRHE